MITLELSRKEVATLRKTLEYDHTTNYFSWMSTSPEFWSIVEKLGGRSSKIDKSSIVWDANKRS